MLKTRETRPSFNSKRETEGNMDFFWRWCRFPWKRKHFLFFFQNPNVSLFDRAFDHLSSHTHSLNSNRTDLTEKYFQQLDKEDVQDLYRVMTFGRLEMNTGWLFSHISRFTGPTSRCSDTSWIGIFGSKQSLFFFARSTGIKLLNPLLNTCIWQDPVIYSEARS